MKPEWSPERRLGYAKRRGYKPADLALLTYDELATLRLQVADKVSCAERDFKNVDQAHIAARKALT